MPHSSSSEVFLTPYKLLTAEIFYYLPDYPHILQSYIWQEYDIAPDYPNLRKFLRFWEQNLEGRLHSVTFSTTGLEDSKELSYGQSTLTLH